MWLHSLKVAQLLGSAACLHTNQSRSYLNHLANTSGVCNKFILHKLLNKKSNPMYIQKRAQAILPPYSKYCNSLQAEHLSRHLQSYFRYFMFVDCAYPYNPVNKPTWCTIFILSIFIFVNLYMFRAVMCCLVCRAERNVPPCIPHSHPYRKTNTKCRINTVLSSDDRPYHPETCRD